MHQYKLDLHGIRLVRGLLRIIAAHVHFSTKPSWHQPPAPLKMPLFHNLSMYAKIAKLLWLPRSVFATKLRRAHAPILEVRALYAHMSSKSGLWWTPLSTQTYSSA